MKKKITRIIPFLFIMNTTQHLKLTPTVFYNLAIPMDTFASYSPAQSDIGLGETQLHIEGSCTGLSLVNVTCARSSAI